MGRSLCLKNVNCLTFLFRAKNKGLDPVLRCFSAVRVVKNVWCLSSLIAEAGGRLWPQAESWAKDGGRDVEM